MIKVIIITDGCLTCGEYASTYTFLGVEEYRKIKYKEIIMSKVAVVYWSGTGNTETMADEIVSKLSESGVEVSKIFAGDFSEADIANYDGFAFGCPAMGSEELEEDVFEPMFESVEDKLGNKPVVLFGSYSWAEGEWMQTWTERCKDKGINLVADGLIAYDQPQDDDLEACRNLAGSLASSL